MTGYAIWNGKEFLSCLFASKRDAENFANTSMGYAEVVQYTSPRYVELFNGSAHGKARAA